MIPLIAAVAASIGLGAAARRRLGQVRRQRRQCRGHGGCSCTRCDS